MKGPLGGVVMATGQDDSNSVCECVHLCRSLCSKS